MIINPRNMIRKEKYTIEEVLSKAKLFIDMKKTDPRQRVEFDGDLMKMASDRYKCFILSGTKCVSCGIEGQYFFKERDSKGTNKTDIYHFNLYAVDGEGNEVLMTKDHIIPVSKGGKNELANYQTMCSHCNEDKDDNIYEDLSLKTVTLYTDIFGIELNQERQSFVGSFDNRGQGFRITLLKKYINELPYLVEVSENALLLSVEKCDEEVEADEWDLMFRRILQEL
jgi:hypothetical protein